MKKSLALAVAVGAAVMSGQALATNGYFTHGLGTKNQGMAGAGTASPQEAMATAMNPASAVIVGDRKEAGIAIFSPNRSYSVSASQLQMGAEMGDATAMGYYGAGAFTLDAGNVESGSNYFPIPHFAATWATGDNTAAGVAIYGRGGMNTDYNGGSAYFMNALAGEMAPSSKPGTFGGGNAGVNLMQLFVDLSLSGQSGELSYGASLVMVAQSFEAKGMGNFTPYTTTFNNAFGAAFQANMADVMAGNMTAEQAMGASAMAAMGEEYNLTDRGADISTGVGLGLGVIWSSDNVNLSAQYKSKVSMSEFDKYSDLFAEGGSFDIPSSFGVGASFKTANGGAFHYDFEQINYSDVASISNPMANLFTCPIAVMMQTGEMSSDSSGCLGGANGAGFGWTDVQVHKLGYEWSMAGSPEVRYRVGASFGENPIASSEAMFNILAPGVIENHYTAGFTRKLGDGSEYSVSLMYAPEASTSGANPLDPSQTIEIKMDQWSAEFSYSW
jgi:long-chain fatty acid transport protein